jgi:enoyl-CoA hydratase/carnithine racemase
LIDRCFWPNTIEEILENLRKEDDKFAKEILERMESNSMLSMKLALKMIRKAKNMCFRDVLNMELNVAMNKVQDSDFKIGVQNILMKPNNYGKHIPRSNPGYLKHVSDELVESYFI